MKKNPSWTCRAFPFGPPQPSLVKDTLNQGWRALRIIKSKCHRTEILSTHKHITVSRMSVNLHNICMKMPWKETHGSYHRQHFLSTRRGPDHSCYAMSNPRSCNCVFNMQSATSGTVVVHPSDWMRIWGQIYSTNIFFRPREVKSLR